ncbi:Nif3-like dinuclear metal center hexameric protein [Oxalobacter sp. OttesenSCG-928-P03]|nr:Nif3-like dinuclear metal center hexameric protein [Oxalobacter sp. OttesenSCG-928-P03]
MDQKTAHRDEITRFLAQKLNISHIRDYCPNGLQVEGQMHIGSIVSGVTASLALINEAIKAGADALLVHHGYFWRDEDPRLTGPKQARIKQLLAHDINLYAYHLPLDMHEDIGNNAMLAKKLGFLSRGRFGENDIGWLGITENPVISTVSELAALIENRLGRKPLLIGDPDHPVETVGWCTGAAQGMLPEAAMAGASVYLSGEISERTVHEAREFGVAYLACGHHATERYGVEALGELLASQFGIRHHFIEIDNPV